jgi:hypothetical protein
MALWEGSTHEHEQYSTSLPAPGLIGCSGCRR